MPRETFWLSSIEARCEWCGGVGPLFRFVWVSNAGRIRKEHGVYCSPECREAFVGEEPKREGKYAVGRVPC